MKDREGGVPKEREWKWDVSKMTGGTCSFFDNGKNSLSWYVGDWQMPHVYMQHSHAQICGILTLFLFWHDRKTHTIMFFSIYFHILLQTLGNISFSLTCSVKCCACAVRVIHLPKQLGLGVEGCSFSDTYQFSSILGDNRDHLGFCRSFHLANTFKQGFIFMFRELYLIANDHIHPPARWNITIASENYTIFLTVSFINQ